MTASLQPVDRRGDVGELLRSLDGDPADAIRRPPLAAQQALAACRDPNASLDAILATVHQDPALSQSLLRHANSPFHATGGGPVSSLRDAASRVGLSGLHGVLIGSMVEGMLCRPGGEFGPMAQQVWQHMVRTAPIARRVGRALRLPPETCYTLGLLHDLGKLIVFDRLTAMRTANRQSLRIRYPVLKDLLGKLHGALGGVAALKWNLDVEGARAIASHTRGAYRTLPGRVVRGAGLHARRERRRDSEPGVGRGGVVGHHRAPPPAARFRRLLGQGRSHDRSRDLSGNPRRSLNPQWYPWYFRPSGAATGGLGARHRPDS